MSDALEGLHQGFNTIKEWLIIRRCEIIPAMMILALFEAGYQDAPAWAIADIIASIIVSILICNPFHSLCGVMAKSTRTGAAVSIIVAMVGIQLPDIPLYMRVETLILAAIILAVAAKTQKSAIVGEKIKQSPEVDKAIAYLCDKGIKPRAQTSWEERGARECRALLHQALKIEIAESSMQVSHRACYTLGYLHGESELAKKLAELEAENESLNQSLIECSIELDRVSAPSNKLEEELEAAKSEIRRLELWGRNNEALAKKSSLLIAENAELKAVNAHLSKQQPEENAEPETQEQEPTKEMALIDRDEACYQYYESGHSYQQTAHEFGLSKSGARAAIARARERRNQ
jgi:DNA-binding CsgD family transcriptional regulator